MNRKLLHGLCLSSIIILCSSCDSYMESFGEVARQRYGVGNVYMTPGYGSSFNPMTSFPDPHVAAARAAEQIKNMINNGNSVPYYVPVVTTGAGNTTMSNGSSNSSSSQSSYVRDCHLCHGSGKCNTCYGSHKYINPLTNKYVTCPNCKPDGACSACGGSGKKR